MKKLKAGSLQLVTFIVVIIALLLASFIILIHIHKRFRIKTDHVIETVRLVDKGMDYALKNEIKGKDTISIPLQTEDYKSIKLHQSYWGVFQKLHTEASIKNTRLEKTALIGSKIDKQNQPSLILKDNSKPLVLVGYTQIKGKAYLPKRGVKSGNIAGTSYYGDKYIYGNIVESKEFPRINFHLLNHIKTIDNYSDSSSENLVYLNLEASKKHVNSFESPMQIIYSNSNISLSNIAVTGHIRIQSRTKIIVDASAKLKDVILIAPIIEIQKNVIGTFQAFATESISVGKHVTLEYPSALVFVRDYEEKLSEKPNWIFVDDHSTVKGNILALGSSLPNNYDAQIRINPNAVVKGVIYCEQNLELRGTVYGTVYTNNFLIKEKGSIYQNHLYNAKISCTDIEQEFVNLFMEHSKKGIAKWLY